MVEFKVGVDDIAFELIKSFIREGFPSSDAEKQVEIAYLYANAISKYKEKPVPIPEDICPKCQQQMSRVDASDFQHPGRFMWVCKPCREKEIMERNENRIHKPPV